MGRLVTFVVYNTGKPTGKQRPRLNRNTGSIYTPSKTNQAEWEIRQVAVDAFEDGPLVGPLRLYVKVCLSRPASHTRKKRESPWCATKPDADNYQKTVQDALNEVAYADDNAIVMWGGAKIYVDGPSYWEITLEELDVT